MKTTEKIPGALIRQAHGGALRQGGTNRGGPGRPPDWIRRRLLRIVSRDGVSFLAGVLKGAIPGVTIGHRLRAFEIAARYALPRQINLTVVSPEIRHRLHEQAQAILDLVPAEYAGPLVQRLDEIWK